MPRTRRCVLAALAATLAFTASTNGADANGALMLVARPELQDAIYGSSILIAAPLRDGSYVGFIINKPTRLTLGQLFPEDAPSRKAPGPVGGELLITRRLVSQTGRDNGVSNRRN
jgi:putative AlgH/UPF0301 family transcriptional regulator